MDGEGKLDLEVFEIDILEESKGQTGRQDEEEAPESSDTFEAPVAAHRESLVQFMTRRFEGKAIATPMQEAGIPEEQMRENLIAKNSFRSRPTYSDSSKFDKKRTEDFQETKTPPNDMPTIVPPPHDEDDQDPGLILPKIRTSQQYAPRQIPEFIHSGPRKNILGVWNKHKRNSNGGSQAGPHHLYRPRYEVPRFSGLFVKERGNTSELNTTFQALMRKADLAKQTSSFEKRVKAEKYEPFRGVTSRLFPPFSREIPFLRRNLGAAAPGGEIRRNSNGLGDVRRKSIGPPLFSSFKKNVFKGIYGRPIPDKMKPESSKVIRMREKN
jgi:hypothetical protein